ncbi:MAG: hypothetical protein R3E73_11445 [Porticoccaceae bacterium]
MNLIASMPDTTLPDCTGSGYDCFTTGGGVLVDAERFSWESIYPFPYWQLRYAPL